MDRAALVKKGVLLEYITVVWNAIQTVVAAVIGVLAGSIALVGFGLVSVVGTASVGMLLRRMLLELKGRKPGDEPTLSERKALFAIGVAFFLLALYVLNESGSRLYYKEKPEESIAGIVLVAFSVIVTTALAVMKFRAAKALGSRALRADAAGTAVGVSLPLIAGAGLLLHVQLGWWWADPVAALLMLPFIFRDGWSAVEESKGTTYHGGTVKLGS